MCEKRRGVVMIVRRGDPEITGAIEAGMERGARVPYPPFGVLPHCGGEALGPRAAQGLRNVAFRRHSPEELEDMIEEARVIYGGQRATPKALQWLVIGYALICYGVSLLYHAQNSMMEGGRTDVW